MSHTKELVFEPINFEEQKKNQPGALNYETHVRENKNGTVVDTNDETGFMFHQYSQFAPKEIKTADKTICYKPAQRNYIKTTIYPDQQSCLELEEQINAYDDALDENREIVFGTYNKLFTHIRSVKEPKEADDLDAADPDKVTKPKYKSVKMRLQMGWNYYLDDQVLDSKNSSIVRNAFFDAKKKKIDPKNVVVKLTFKDDEEVETTREVKIGDIKQEKDKILTKVMFRRPQSIPTDAKKVEDCTEKELVKFYGKGEILEINTSDDLDRYYRGGCYIRYVYEPEKIYAQRAKGDDGKRKCSYIFQIKLIDIINTKQYTSSTNSNKQYEDYAFRRRGQENNDTEENKETEEDTPVLETTKSSTKSTKQVVIEQEEDDIDGEEQEEEQEEQEVEDEDEPVVETKARGRGKVVVEETKPKAGVRKPK